MGSESLSSIWTGVGVAMGVFPAEGAAWRETEGWESMEYFEATASHVYFLKCTWLLLLGSPALCTFVS